MTGIALLLVGVSVGDLVAGGLAGEPTSRNRVILAVVTCLGTIGVLAFGLDLSVANVLSITVLVVLVTSAWLIAKGTLDRGSVWDRPAAALAILAVGFLGIAALSGSWIPGDDGWLSAWLITLPDTLGARETEKA